MMAGTVRHYNHNRGFGFITPDDGGGDVYLSQRALARSGVLAPHRGDRMRFAVVKRDGKPMARNLEPVRRWQAN